MFCSTLQLRKLFSGWGKKLWSCAYGMWIKVRLTFVVIWATNLCSCGSCERWQSGTSFLMMRLASLMCFTGLSFNLVIIIVVLLLICDY